MAKRQKPGGGKKQHRPWAKGRAPAPVKAEKPAGVDPTTCNRLYSDEEAAFLKAVERYRRERKRPFPVASELLAIAVSLGYRKVADPTPLPGTPA